MISVTCPVELYVLPDDRDDAVARVTGAIVGAKQYYYAAMYEFGDMLYAGLLLAAFKRGVDVRILMDHVQSTGAGPQKVIRSLLASGFPAQNLLVTTSIYRQIMHDKLSICDDALLIEGSYNWSVDAREQDNTMTVLTSPDLAQALKAKFLAHWQWTLTNEANLQVTA